MRGKVAYTDLQRPSPGITPAYAGKSLLKLLHHVGLRDHPRVCGEKAYSLVINGSEWGSPPRMRGKGTKRCSSRRGGRITPAYAGKSKRIAPSSVLFGDHPRVCGEKSRTCSIVLDVGGSPPRMRGKAWSAASGSRRSGITPAYAGKRLKRSHRIGHFSCILCLFHSVLHRASASGGSRAGPCAPPCLPAQNAVPV